MQSEEAGTNKECLGTANQSWGTPEIHVHEKQEERLKMRQSEPEELTRGVAGRGEP